MLNTIRRPIKSVPYQAAADYINLPRDMRMMWLECRLTGTLTIAGGATDYALIDATETIARLIQALGIEFGNFPLFDLNFDGPDHKAINRYLVLEPLPQVELAGGGVAVTNFEFNFYMPFSLRRLTVNPINTALPRMPEGRDFRLRYQFASSIVAGNAANSQGTGAILGVGAGGDRSATLTNIAFNVVAVGAKKATVPWYIPLWTLQNSRTFVGAENDLDVRLQQGTNPLALQIVRAVAGPNRVRDDKITRVTLRASGEDYYQRVDWSHLVRFDRGDYAAKTATFNNEHLFLWADGGKLTNSIRAQDYSDATLFFDVAAPTVNPGQIRIIRGEMLTDPGLTRLPEGIAV